MIIANAATDEMPLWNADDYDENSRLQQTIARNFLSLIHKQFSLTVASPQLLDIGCGSGRITKLIQNTFPGVCITGVDASIEMVEYAKQHYADSKAAFYLDRAEELQTIESNSQDAITSFSCLHWVHDIPAAFKSMDRVLKRGGWIGLMFAAETGFDDPIDRVYAQVTQESPWDLYFKQAKKEIEWNIVEPKSVKAQLEELGFQVVFMADQNFDYSFQDFSAFVSWIQSSFQQLKSLPKEMQGPCAKRIAELYVHETQGTQDTTAPCMYRVDAFMVMAIKPKEIKNPKIN